MGRLSRCFIPFGVLLLLAGCSDEDGVALSDLADGGDPADEADLVERDLLDGDPGIETDHALDLEADGPTSPDIVQDPAPDGDEHADLAGDPQGDVIPDHPQDPSDVDPAGDTSDPSVDQVDAPDPSGDTSSDMTADPAEDRESDVEPDVPLDGFGVITGQCGFIGEAEIWATDSLVFQNAIDFGDDPYDESDFDELSPGGRTLMTTPNEGGDSLESEAFSYEVLYRCELADLLETETGVCYDPPESDKTDILVEIDGYTIGVSVTRAVNWPRTVPYTVEQAQDHLTEKLLGVNESSQNVCEEHAWVKQILHIIAYNPQHAEVVRSAFALIDESIRLDTILVITVTDGDDAFLY